MDVTEIQVRLELLKLAKDITEVNSITDQAVPGSAQHRAFPKYSIDQVLLAARRLYEFVMAEEAGKTAA